MVNQQLVLARQFFDEARRSPAAETPYVRMKRIHHLDLCVEIALNVIVNDNGTPEDQANHGAKRTLDWHKLWDLADDISKRIRQKSLPERYALKVLHETRNLAHHCGVVPGVEAITQGVEPTRSLLDFVCREFYEAEFERLQEWHALQCEPLRSWMGECYNALEQGMNVVAVAGSRVAYDRMVLAVRHEAAGDLLSLQRGLPSGAAQLRDAVDTLQEALTMLEAGIVAVGLGLSFADHYRYMRVCRGLYPNPILTSRLNLLAFPQHIRAKEFSDDIAEFAVQYVGKAATYLESAYPGVFDALQFDRALRSSPLWKQHEPQRDSE